MMFDWKRSTKVIDPEHSPGICAEPSLNSWGRTGIGTFSDLPSTSSRPETSRNMSTAFSTFSTESRDARCDAREEFNLS